METRTLRKKPDSDANDVFKAHLNNFTFSKAGFFFVFFYSWDQSFLLAQIQDNIKMLHKISLLSGDGHFNKLSELSYSGNAHPCLLVYLPIFCQLGRSEGFSAG